MFWETLFWAPSHFPGRPKPSYARSERRSMRKPFGWPSRNVSSWKWDPDVIEHSMSRVSRCERHIAFLYLNASEWQIMSGTLNFSVIHVRTRNHVPIAYKYIVFFSEALCYEFSSFQWVTWPKSLTLLRFEVAGSEYRCFDSVISKVWDVQIILAAWKL